MPRRRVGRKLPRKAGAAKARLARRRRGPSVSKKRAGVRKASTHYLPTKAPRRRKATRRVGMARRRRKVYITKTKRHGPRRGAKGMSGPVKSALWGIAGALLVGALNGAKTEKGLTFAQSVPQIPFIGPEGTFAAVLYAAGWAFRVPLLKKLALGPAVIAGYKLSRGVAQAVQLSPSAAAIPGAASTVIMSSMSAAGLPDDGTSL